MRSKMGKLHSRVIANAPTEMKSRMTQIAIDCLMRHYDATGDLSAYLDAESLWLPAR